MHNLFLGLVQHHFRDLIAIKKPEKRPVDVKEIDRGRIIFQSNPTISTMTRLRMPVLEVLIQEAGVTLGTEGRTTKKKIIEALMTKHTDSFLLNKEAQMEIDDDTFVTEELVKECATEAEAKNDQNSVSAELLTDKEINSIQAELRGIQRPSWHRGPPKNLGDAEHGKLKAEQWRSAIEFDLPVTLLAHSTMLLSMAIRWGTSHVTSTHHAQQYVKYMKAYLECIQDAVPGHSFRPNHHACLHLHEFLLRYGPMHGWWMFPFERVIGGLQKTNMNYKIGELEKTMLETFCAAAKVKAIIQDPGAPNVIIKAAEILQQCCAPFAGEGFHTDTGVLRTVTDSDPYVSHDNANIIKTPISDVLRYTWENTRTHMHGSEPITEYKQLNVAGLQYCSRNYSTSDSCVFFKNTSGNCVPGVVEHMMSTGQDHNRVYYIAVRCYLPVIAGYQDPFSVYGDFGAQIWSCASSNQLEIVPVCGSRMCHGILMNWGSSELVLKPMNRVSFDIIHH
ncbi:uncharacterized protein F5891DRAFT_959320 [Suillus fuscotomentosus]|uniref:Uncharacterized protein n=1 Tax=Suillus fuscotomentosus TaxID=1912939 RepID=A0AAD4DXJ7_9AGAM|nr:uncharacterized protein F5891DRAFT_959320 [Suillus fuscotomentosus]KAG1895988.1 hypothetical protein F5891DRAFT_959320 [Suillus fuscotomentosus]